MSRVKQLPQPYSEALFRAPIFQDVEGLEAVPVQIERLRAGQEICAYGDAADCMWIVAEGRVSIEREGRVLAEREVGRAIGEQALFEADAVRSADMRAGATGVVLLRITEGALNVLSAAAKVQLHQNLARVLSRKLREATESRNRLQADVDKRYAMLERYVGRWVLSEEEFADREALGPQLKPCRAVIFFSDVVGFSTMAAEMPAHELGELAGAFLSVQEVAIEGNGGFIDKFIGDAVMAFWIIDGDEPATCAKAVRAALAAIDRVHAIDLHGMKPRLRVGLHVGEVVAGVLGSHNRVQYTLVGDEVNRAARLEQARSEPGLTLGALRASAAVCERLPEDLLAQLPVQFETEVKGMKLTGRTTVGAV